MASGRLGRPVRRRGRRRDRRLPTSHCERLRPPTSRHGVTRSRPGEAGAASAGRWPVTILAVTHRPAPGLGRFHRRCPYGPGRRGRGRAPAPITVRSALALVHHRFGIALLFIDQGADPTSSIRLTVHGDPVLYVIMLLGVDRKGGDKDKLKKLNPIAIFVGVVALADPGAGAGAPLGRRHEAAAGALNEQGKNVQKLISTFTAYLLPFEMTSPCWLSPWWPP